ncbi:MAG TPA: hypothetical protein VFN18_09935 [Solirubrobacterales bacterium]|nr:hypothetical protein [Solirubrobacterales bacterium]
MNYLKKICLATVAAVALMAIGAGYASATTLEVNGVGQASKAVTLSASLEAGTSALLKDSAGTTADTCSESDVEGTTETDATSKNYSGPTVTGTLATLSFGKCSHLTKVISKGKLHVEWITSTTNGTVSSSGAEVTVLSTAFGVTAVCKTGGGTVIGTLTGATNGSSNKTNLATMDINGKISCGILGTSTWTGSYTVTSPAELGVIG